MECFRNEVVYYLSLPFVGYEEQGPAREADDVYHKSQMRERPCST